MATLTMILIWIENELFYTNDFEGTDFTDTLRIITMLLSGIQFGMVIEYY
jgi:hypothetical protein